MVLRAAADLPEAPDNLSSVILGAAETGAALAANEQVPLVSATGSIPYGTQSG